MFPTGLVLVADDDLLLDEMSGVRIGRGAARPTARPRTASQYATRDRGALKQALLAAGWPAADEAGFDAGPALGSVPSRPTCATIRRDAIAGVVA